jgi:hypothetical protein
MAEPNHSVIRDFFEWVRQARDYAVLDPSGQERRAFISIQKVEAHFEYLHRQNLIEILHALFPEDPLLYAENIVPRYTAIFCILLHINKGRYILEFTKHASLRDTALPFDPVNRPSKFPLSAEDPDFFSRFCNEQWKWCAPIFHRYMLNEHFEAKIVLPIIFKEKLGDGGSATIYKIRIHNLFNDLLSDDLKTVSLSTHDKID